MRILRKVDHMAVPGWVAAVSQDDAGGHHLVDGRSGVLRYVLQVLVGHHIIPHPDPFTVVQINQRFPKQIARYR